MGAETEVVEPMSSDDVGAADNETADEPSRDQQRKRKKLLYKSIQDLMEFYLGDVNLSKNRFIYHHIQGKPYVYMDLAIFLTFNKVKALTSNVEDIAKAIANSELLEVSKDGTHVCRKRPITRKENEDECTLYVEQLNPEVDPEMLMKIFSEYGPVDYISMPKFARSNKYKGFAFVEFRDSECATKALEVLSSRGCCLSPRMAPGELMSIRTFDTKSKETTSKKIKFEDKSNNAESSGKSKEKVENTDESKYVNNKSNKLKRKPSNDEEFVNSHNEEPCTSNKAKKKRKSTESEENSREQAKSDEISENDEPQTSTSKCTKRKHSVDTPEASASEPMEKKSKPNVEAEEESEDSKAEDGEESKLEEGEEGKEKKKRKKRKKVKKDKVSAVSLGLKVLSKLEWKHLRNNYLNMQRDTMRSLKQQLSYSRVEREPARSKGEETIKTEPGTVVKITLEQPVTDIKATKNEMRVHPEIRYVDLTEGSNVVYLRASTSELASSLIQSQHWPTMEIISGEEEQEYWEKMKKDREDFFNKSKPNYRGRTKLLKKAERIQGANTFEASASQT